jgi:hypothetical protein
MYQSNPLLRSATEKIEYTDEMKKEWLRCAEDIFYFAEKYFYVVEIDKGRHVIQLRDYQKKMLAAMANPPQRPDDHIPHKQHAIVLASRQIGKSVVCRIILLHFVLFNRDKTAAILANKEKTAHKLMKEFKDSYMQLPMWLQQGVVEGGWNKGEVNFENGMCVVASSSSSNAIRSYSISLLMLDEFAFVPDNIASEFFSSVYPTISSGKKSKVIIVSTPNGMNHFYRMWQKAARGDSGYYPIKINWWEVPGRDENFKQETIANLQGGIVEWNQEYGCRFLGSSNTLIDPDVLERVDTQSPSMLKWNGAFQIFEPPAPAAEYVLGIDPGKGTRRDYSVIQVLRLRSEKDVEQVAIYRNNEIDTHAFAQVCISVSDYYNEAEMMIENNGCGEGLLNTIWYEFECDRVVNCERKGLGINANKKSKLAANLNTKRYIEEGWCKIHDQTTVYELSRYIEHKLNIFACETKDGHDDTVTSLNWGLWFPRTPYYTGKRTRKKPEIEDQYKLTEEEKESLPAAIMNEEEEFEDYNDEPLFMQGEGF